MGRIRRIPRLAASNSIPQSKWTPEAIEKRLQERAERQVGYDMLVDSLKEEGNQHFKRGEYEDATAIYAAIVVGYGLKSVVVSDYVASLLKLEAYGEAEAMATEGLKLDPKNLELRFRRAMARKNLRRYNAAITDLNIIISAGYNCNEARQELWSVLPLVTGPNTGYEDLDPDEAVLISDPAFPRLDMTPYPDEEAESDSEDYIHAGNGIGCKHYNRGTCQRGTTCTYSHACDWKSQRDKLGRNVCNYFLFGKCRFGEQCRYIHDKSYLPDGWWDDPEAISLACTLFDRGGLKPHDLEEALTPMLATHGRPKEYPHYAKIDSTASFSRRNRASTEDQILAAERRLQPRPGFVMVLALTRGIDDPFKLHTLTAIQGKIDIHIATEPQQALQYLDAPDLVGVFVADSAIHEQRYANILERLVQYVKGGGRVVMGGSFSGQISPAAMDRLFSWSWNLPWKFGDYFRTTFSTNLANQLARANELLPESYSMKVVHLKGVPITQAVYYAADESYLESITNGTETPAAFAKVEKGYVGYLGDVNWEKGSAKVILAMLDLLEAPSRPFPTAFRIPPSYDPGLTFNGTEFIDDF